MLLLLETLLSCFLYSMKCDSSPVHSDLLYASLPKTQACILAWKNTAWYLGAVEEGEGDFVLVCYEVSCTFWLC